MNRMQLTLAACAVAVAGCAHQVTFERPEAYRITTPRQEASATAVIDSQTLANKVSIRAFMTGIAHDWQAEPGDMLKQVADIELPQTQGGKMFWGGAFAMKSAIRQSSLDAYKKVFAQLRADLEAALAK